MRAAVVERYGPPDVVHVTDVPDPSPGKGQVLVRVRSAAVTSGDARIRGAWFPGGFGLLARLALGIRGPRRRILGSACAGVVTMVGPDVTAFAPGDEVCGMNGTAMGAHAELVAMKASRVVRTPAGVGPDDAAGVLFGGSTALHFLGKATIGPGTRVLVNGASGAIGTIAVQLAHRAGATVTGVTSGANVALVTRLGAEHVVDHTAVDVTTIPERFDVVLDTVGNLTIASGRGLLADGGVLLLAVATLGQTIRARGNVAAGPAPERAAGFAHLLDLVAAGELTVVVDGVHPLDDIVAAHAWVDTGRKVGNVLVRP